MTQSFPKVYLVCGSGGVGKTTVSASLGLKEMTKGQKTLVITIDPAKRLANALGLKNLTDTATQIQIDSSSGELWAMMLDTKHTFDKLIERYAPNPTTKNLILNNFLYQNLSEMIAGSQDYMAMEKLFEIWKQNHFDVIVIDTPPVQNAIDFLEAPHKMTNLIDHSLIKWLAKPTVKIGQSGWNLFERGSKSILKIFGQMTGFSFLEEIRNFLTAFSDMMTGFKARALEIQNLLQSSQSQFLLVCCPETSSLKDIQGFQQKIASEKFHLSHIILNRFHGGILRSPSQIKKDEIELKELLGVSQTKNWIENYKNFKPLIEKSHATQKELKAKFPNLPLTVIPFFQSDVHDLKSLKKMAKAL